MAPLLSIYEISEEVRTAASDPTNIPHRHDHHEIILLSEGRVDHTIDGENLSIAAPSALLVAQGKIHHIRTDTAARGFVIRFSADYLPAESASLFVSFIDRSDIQLGNERLKAGVFSITELLAGAGSCSNSDVPRHLLAALLALLSDESRRIAAESGTVTAGDYALFHRFLKTLDRSYTMEKSVEFYAADLSITAKKLSTLCRAMYGRGTAQLIEDRAVIEAKRLLMYSPENIQQIAFALGYDDHSYFSKIFRRATGLSPTEFRLQHGV